MKLLAVLPHIDIHIIKSVFNWYEYFGQYRGGRSNNTMQKHYTKCKRKI